jgi:hypothetical protein
MGGMQDNGNGLTIDGGATWQMTTSGDGMECLFDYADPDIVYASIQNGLLTKSTDGGHTFPSFIYNAYSTWITPLIMHPTDHNTLFTANLHIVKSANAGNSWTPIAYNVAPVKIHALAQSKVNPSNMIFATGGGISPVPDTVFVVKISTDEGYTWTDVTGNIPGEVRWISRVAADPWEEHTMYVLRTGYSEGNKLWKTTDLGQTWTNISGDLPDLPCSDLFIGPDNTDHIYIANDIGIYLTTDGGVTWEYCSHGMPFVPVFDFDYVKIGNVKYLRAATHGRSIYQTDIISVGLDENPESLLPSTFDFQCYPNPSRGIFNIQFTVYNSQSVSCSIYDVYGREVAVVMDGMCSGDQVARWDASGLPAGVYFVELRVEGPSHRAVEKMVKMD